MEPRSFAAFRARAHSLAKRLARTRFDDGEGLPAADPRVVLVSRAVTAFATLALVLISFWEIGAPFGAGHYAAATAVAQGGENMLRFGTLGAVPRWLAEAPLPRDYYCHHPWGVFWTAALFVGVFGHNDFVCRLPAALMSSAMPLLLYGAGRALFGPVSGALGAVAYVVTPITLSYANFFALEVPTMFAMAFTTFVMLRFLQTSRRRFAVLAVLGMGLAASFDWTGFVFDALVLGGLFLRGFVLRRHFGPLDFERFATLWASAVAVVAALALFHVAAFQHLGHLGELLAQGEARASGSNLPLERVLESRRYWLLLAFTPLAIGLGKIAAPILAARVVLFGREGELFPLAVLATAIFQYVVFKQGADIHFFWPQYFALYFAFAVGALSASALEIGAFALARSKHERFTPVLPFGVLVAGLVTLSLMVPDAARALTWARKSGGRFNEKGLIIHPDLDKSAVFSELSRTLPEAATLGVDASMKPSYWMDFTLEREVTHVSAPRRGHAATTHFAVDSRFASPELVRSLARDYAVHAYGPYWIADTGAPHTPVVGFAALRREPGFFERWFVSYHHALYDIAPSPYWTWELREHFGVEPNPVPGGAPRIDERRSAHNAAVARGDAALARRLRSELLSGVDGSVAREFSLGARLLGVRLERGASDVLTVYFEAGGPLAGGPGFAVTSIVEEAPRHSLVPPDALAWNVGMPFALPTSSWRPGFVYESVTELVRRPGRERYIGAFHGAGAPEPLSGPEETTLAVLE
ncbi:MAG TPA: glycosyltransferase family 39 protein [Polyangiaceae bacterium]